MPDNDHKTVRENHGFMSPKLVFFALIINHILCSLHKFLFVYEFSDEWSWKETVERYNKRMRFAMQIVQLLIFSEISYYWVFVPCHNTKNTEDQEWKKFEFFMTLECYVFVMNLFAAMVFMMVRSLFHN